MTNEQTMERTVAMELRVTINALAHLSINSGEAGRLRLEALALVDKMEDDIDTSEA